MRKITSGLFISVDGVVEAPDQWQFDNFDEDMGSELAAALGAQDAVLLGRVTFEEWAAYWPNFSGEGGDRAYADFINNAPKYVVSSTLDNVNQWQNSTLIRGAELVRELGNLKQQPGKDIGVQGSPTLVRSLLNLGLLDQLQLLIHPVVAGRGKHLFRDGDDLKRLHLVEARPTRSGVIIATYRPKE